MMLDAGADPCAEDFYDYDAVDYAKEVNHDTADIEQILEGAKHERSRSRIWWWTKMLDSWSC